MKSLRGRTYLLVLLIILSACLSGCGTVRGAGQDIEYLGESIQGSSK